MIDNLLDRINEYTNNDILISDGSISKYSDLINKISYYQKNYKKYCPGSKNTILLKSKLTVDFIALFLVLLKQNNIVVPLSNHSSQKNESIKNISNPDICLDMDGSLIRSDIVTQENQHPMKQKLLNQGKSGIILFTSGTSGPPKAILHDAQLILNKYETKGRKERTLSFMAHDHIGGLNTILYTLFNGGTLILSESYNAERILEQIQDYKVTLLPTTPSFLNMLLLTHNLANYDLSSVNLITYGTEPMDKRTLVRLNELFPDIKFKQTYGMTEIGILSMKSEESSSLEVTIDRSKNDYKIIDGILFIKSNTSMIGYLNYDSPFTDDGWMNTGDRVVENGDRLIILGRDSELINVGGEKVFPIEVENILKENDSIADASVYALDNRLLGQIVAADVAPKEYIDDEKNFIISIKNYCINRMDKHKVPIKINIVNKIKINERYKKVRI